MAMVSANIRLRKVWIGGSSSFSPPSSSQRDRPVIDSKVISSTGGVRDPHILRSEDGRSFYMVLTDMTSHLGWSSNRAFVMLRSDDLVHWSASVINIQEKYEEQDD